MVFSSATKTSNKSTRGGRCVLGALWRIEVYLHQDSSEDLRTKVGCRAERMDMGYMLMDTIWWILPFGIHVNTASELICCAWFRSFLEILFDSSKCKYTFIPQTTVERKAGWPLVGNEGSIIPHHNHDFDFTRWKFPTFFVLPEQVISKDLLIQNNKFPVWWCWWQSHPTGEARSEERHPKMHSFASLGTSPGGAKRKKKERNNSTSLPWHGRWKMRVFLMESFVVLFSGLGP